MSEWEAYISGLAGPDLWSQAVSANTMKFVNMLLAEHYTMADVEHIMVLFVRRLAEVQMKIPEEGAFDLVELGRRDPIATQKA